ncbi:MAG: tail fiber domain-containing protein [Luminiphilus sp.]
MGITRPTGEQLRFRSQYTGDHILDTYLESSEKGSRQLSDLLDDLFDSNGTFRSGNFEFRFDASTDKIQFRAGNFATPNAGWTDITTFFNITGAFNASTTYNNFDLITLTNKDVYIVHGLSSGTTFADEAAVIASANTEKLVDVSEARDWASKTTGQVVSTDYSAKAYAVGGTGIDTTTGSAKDWAIKTSGTIGNTGEYSAKYWATSTAVTTVSSGIANINTVAASISNVNTVASDIANVNTVAGISANVTSVANIDTDVTTVAGISANTTTVAGIAPNVTTVAGVATNVTTVAGISGNVTTVANNSTNVTTVATNVADVNTVAGEINNNNLQTVANDIQAVITLADDLNEATSEIDTVANSITNVDAVGNDITNVNTVATNIANVNTSATNIANVNTVAGISANVTTVAGISADVTTTATNNANITTVAGISSNVTTVAGISSNVTTVAGIAADVTTAATNVVAFNNTYLGAQASAPTADPDGSALDLGDLYFDTSTNTMKVYSSSGWTNAGSSVNGTADRFSYTATAAQTTFSGNDANGNALAYDAGFLDVYMNGVKLVNGSDFTATSGTSIVLASGAALNDTIEIIAYGTFTLSNQSINDMTDVTTGGITNGQFLQWNSTNSQFEPATVATSLDQDATPQLGGDLDTNGNDINFGDNDKAIFGAGSDLQIYHDGGNSLIQDAGTGDLILKSNGAATVVKTNAGNNLISARDAGSVGVFYDGSEKLTTASYGIDVNGTVNCTGRFLSDTVGAGGGAGSGYQFGGDGNTGMYQDAYDQIQFSTNGAERLRIDSSGRVGIGQSSMSSMLHVRPSSDTNSQITIEHPSGGNSYGGFVRSLSGTNQGLAFGGYFNGISTERMILESSGNLVIGGSPAASDARLTLMHTDPALFFHDTSAGQQDGAIQVSNGTMKFLNGANTNNVSGLSERMRLTNTGDLLVSTTNLSPHTDGSGIALRESAGILVGVSGGHAIIAARHSSDGECIRLQRDNTDVGSIDVTSSGTTYTTTSDRRLKTDIQPIEHATDMLMAMNPVTHRWKADPDADAVVGFIAQEMQEIVPEAVSGDPEGEEMMSMDYGRITPVLVAALQDAHKKIEALEERLAELEAK